ncbi:MAG: hypothetical protein WC369_10320 [Dehalococcoidales bacterium]|jgi:hypothetical protein
MSSHQVNLSVNDSPIPLDYFIQNLVDHVTTGIILALEGTGDPHSIELAITQGSVSLKVNGVVVPTNDFVNKVTTSTLYGLVGCLKGGDHIESLRIEIQK